MLCPFDAAFCAVAADSQGEKRSFTEHYTAINRTFKEKFPACFFRITVQQYQKYQPFPCLSGGSSILSGRRRIFDCLSDSTEKARAGEKTLCRILRNFT
jgi:hypothetical protein